MDDDWGYPYDAENLYIGNYGIANDHRVGRLFPPLAFPIETPETENATYQIWSRSGLVSGQSWSQVNM